ncbi:enoyl-CoA hydratase/isomerase family protein [Hippea maritima]|uniref:Enoyl-CoA hydratase domain-containing protein 3, mitochondrial n=1 Tax=Hippea maritima (strain ATCC 700847 / DSM 10411 / MH2) TaxID=760142 RepID=F2LV83_HIPMA|nr:enoyl-CoA hydratase-related protein [Hippea maritima]AEA33667.1 Enoyl-CoA hydratase/isomerase [Hippea maritima DSM 10411]
MYESIEVLINNHIGFITLAKPENLNVFTSQLARELNDALRDLDKNIDVRVIVIKAKGKGFSAGIDVSELKDKTHMELLETTRLMEEMNLTLTSMKTPTIASVKGFAVANGFGLVALCDLAVAEEGTKFGATAINVGLSCIGPAVALSRIIGRKRTLELLLTGRIIMAEEALEWGLINRVAPKGKLEEETVNLAEELAKKSPLALQITREAFYKMSDLPLEKEIEVANYAFAEICTLKDAEEGINAFLEKRQPNWKLK